MWWPFCTYFLWTYIYCVIFFWLQLVTANTGKINTSNNIEGTEINVLHMDIGVISLVRQGFFLNIFNCASHLWKYKKKSNIPAFVYQKETCHQRGEISIQLSYILQMQFNQFSVMGSKAPEWNFSIETERNRKN